MNLIGLRAHDYGTHEPEELAKRISADGWQSVQLAMPKAISNVPSFADVTQEIAQKTHEAMRQYNIDVAVLGAYVELGMVDETERKKAVADFCTQLSVSKILHARCVGSETTPTAKQPNVTRKEAMMALKRSLSEILPKAEEMGVTVAIEPVFSHTMATPEMTKEVLDDMRSDALRVIFDPVNLMSMDEVEKQPALWDRALNAYGDKIYAVHLKGVRIEKGDFVPCLYRDSMLDYDSVFAMIKQLPTEPAILREEAVKDAAAQEIAFIRKMLFK